MADETPSDTPPPPPLGTPPASPENTPKKETVRITLPSKAGETPVVKRETVKFTPAPAGPGAPPATDSGKGSTIRIGTPGAGPSPKKETTRVITQPPASAVPGAAAPGVGVPPPPSSFPAIPAFSPKPLGTPGSLPGLKPVGPPGGLPGGPPKPPGPGVKTGPLGQPPKPGGPPGAPPMAGAPGAPGVVAKPVPKKETARIQVAPQQKPVLPKATVKMQQTQPMMPMVAPMVAKPVVASEIEEAPETGDDGAVTLLSVVASLVSIAAAVVYYLAYSAAMQ